MSLEPKCQRCDWAKDCDDAEEDVVFADRLRTARKINGTAFDGSNDITTAKWGQARTITIQDADGTNSGDAVSVNGSKNVTLKLPSTIKANIDDGGVVNARDMAVHTPNHLPLFEMLDVGGDRPGLYNNDPAKWGFTLQAPFCDLYNKILYFSHEDTYNNGPKKELIAIRWSEKAKERILLGRSVPGNIVAHQNNALYRPSSEAEPLLFCPYEQYTAGGAHASTSKVRVYKHTIQDNGTITFTEPLRELTLWGDGWTPDTLLRFCITADCRYMISEAVKVSDGKRYRRVWDLAAIMESEATNVTAAHIVYEYEKPASLAAGGQGIYSDGNCIYSLSGDAVTYLSCDTIDGRHCWDRPKIKANDASVEYEGVTSKFEPEGIFWAPYNGSIEMFYFLMVRDAAKHSQYFCLSIAGGEKLEGQYSAYMPVPERQAKASDIVAQGYDTFVERYPEGTRYNPDSDTDLRTWHYDADGLVYLRNGATDTPWMVQDCNLATSPGWYYVDSGDSCVNRPYNNVGYLEVVRHIFSNWSIVQNYYRRGGYNRVAKRSISQGSWTPWYMLEGDTDAWYQQWKEDQIAKVPHLTGGNYSPTGKPLVVVVAGQSNAVGSSELSGRGNLCVTTGKVFQCSALENYQFQVDEDNVTIETITEDGTTKYVVYDTAENPIALSDVSYVPRFPSWSVGIVDPVWPSSSGGWVPAFAEEIALKANRPVFVINVAKGGTCCCDGFIPKRKSNNYLLYNSVNGTRVLYRGDNARVLSWSTAEGWLPIRAKALFDKAIDLLGATDYDFLGTIWLQGEYDAMYAYRSSGEWDQPDTDLNTYSEYLEPTEEHTTGTYSQTLADTLAWFADNIKKPGDTKGHVFVANIPYKGDKETRPDDWTDRVNDVINRIVSADTSGYVHKLSNYPITISMNTNLIQASSHFTQTGYNYLGFRFAQALLRFTVGDTPLIAEDATQRVPSNIPRMLNFPRFNPSPVYNTTFAQDAASTTVTIDLSAFNIKQFLAYVTTATSDATYTATCTVTYSDGVQISCDRSSFFYGNASTKIIILAHNTTYGTRTLEILSTRTAYKGAQPSISLDLYAQNDEATITELKFASANNFKAGSTITIFAIEEPD